MGPIEQRRGPDVARGAVLTSAVGVPGCHLANQVQPESDSTQQVQRCAKMPKETVAGFFYFYSWLWRMVCTAPSIQVNDTVV